MEIKGDKTRKNLTDIVLQYGTNILEDPKKIKNLLSDLNQGTEKREINIICTSVDEMVPFDLIKSKDTLPYDLIAGRSRQRLRDNCGIKEELAEWAVDTWAVALNVISITDIANKKTRTENEEPIIPKNSENVDISILSKPKESKDGLSPDISTAVNEPVDADAWYKKGLAQFNLGRYQEALDACNKSIEINSNYHFAWNEKGRALLNLGRNQEALDAFNKTIIINPNLDYALNNKGLTLLKLGRNQDALEAFDKAISINPNNDIRWNNRGRALLNLDRNQEALDAFNKTIAINPNLDYAWNDKGRARLNLGRNQDALDAFNKTIAINPNLDYAWSNKGLALVKLGRKQEALDACNKSIEINSNYHLAWNNKGWTLIQLGRDREALEALNKAIAINPDNKLALENRNIALKNIASSPKPREPGWISKGIGLFK